MPSKRPVKRAARANKRDAKPSLGSSRPTSAISMAAKPVQTLPPRTSGQVTPNAPPLPLQETDKTADLRPDTLAPAEELTTNQGVTVSDDQNSLKSHVRGPTLLEDILMREKITHFDHERIPERVVHARGAAAHGVFRVYESQAHLTMAAPLQDPAVTTPVFVRFSMVAGSRGSTDTARDVRGFAVKFYTQDGVWDLVGNSMPVFFIRDANKFPDLIHAVKPEPHNEIPQAQSAHDNSGASSR
jgi:catalase